MRDVVGGGPLGFSSMGSALPFCPGSALAPSERYAAKRGRRHKKITEWAWQLLLVVRRWHPQREIVAVARSEEHTSELQSRQYLVCRLLLEKKKKNYKTRSNLNKTKSAI